jgi:hypothetical protein
VGIAVFEFLNWPRPLVIAICVVAGLGPALLLTWGLSRLPARWRTGISSSANGSTVGAVSLLFGLFAAFLANDIWVRNQIAQQAVIEEGDAIRNLARLSEGQSEQSRLELRRALVDYAEVVVNKDWPLMEQGKRSLEVLARVRTLSNLLVSGSVGRDAGDVVQTKMLDAFLHLREKRQVRVILAENRKFTIKWHAMVMFAILTQLAIAIAHIDRPKSMLLAQLVFGVAMSTCLAILILNEFPFSKLNPIASEPIRTAMESLFRE